jgi:hypothetical protein
VYACITWGERAFIERACIISSQCDGSVHYKFSMQWEHALQVLLPMGACIIRLRLTPGQASPRGLCVISAPSGFDITQSPQGDA